MPSIQKFLAIETSTSPGSVAAGTLPSHRDIANRSCQIDDLFMQESRLPETGSQGRHLMPVLAAAVESAGWSLDMTDLVIVATGPGPFTGATSRHYDSKSHCLDKQLFSCRSFDGVLFSNSSDFRMWPS